MRFADEKLKKELNGYIKPINDRIAEEKRRQEEARRRKEEEQLRQVEEQRRKEEEKRKREEEEKRRRKELKYAEAFKIFNSASSEEEYKDASKMFAMISDYKDAADLTVQCSDKAECCRKDVVLANAKAKMMEDKLSGYFSAQHDFKTIPGWKDADKLLDVCNTRIKEIKGKKAEENKLTAKKQKKRTVIICSISASIVVIAVVFAILLFNVIIPNVVIGEAEDLASRKNYASAVKKLDGISYNKEAQKQKEDYLFSWAKELADNKDYATAISKLDEISDNKEAQKQKEDYLFSWAKELADNEDYATAISKLDEIPDNKDAQKQKEEYIIPCISQAKELANEKNILLQLILFWLQE